MFGQVGPLANPVKIVSRLDSSYLILLTLALLGGLAGLLYHFGVIGFAVKWAGLGVRGGIRLGFQVWEAFFSGLSWPAFLGVVLALLLIGSLLASVMPAVGVVTGLAALAMGVVACLAYMYIDLERYEVERGYKAVHNPLKGQELASHLLKYGDRVGVPLMAAAAVGVVGGFALLNQGLYESIGRSWFAIGDDKDNPSYVDFLAYSLLSLYRVIDLLDTANTYSVYRVTVVRAATWPAGALLTAFKTFFTLVLLQQIFASIRQGQALAETIADFWSPHPTIHERARKSLPQHGLGVIRPLLASLRELPTLTKEQRDQLPQVIAAIGPSAMPILIDHLADESEGVRSLSAAALGALGAVASLPRLTPLRDDPSEMVRQEAVKAVGTLAVAAAKVDRSRADIASKVPPRRRRFLRRRTVVTLVNEVPPDAVPSSVFALRAALADGSTAVRVGAAESLGRIGPAAADAAPDLVRLLRDRDETVRCRVAETLGQIGDPAVIPALTEELGDPSPAVKQAAARALGAFKEQADESVPHLAALLQDPEEGVRSAAAEAIGKIGTLHAEATASLVGALGSRDTLVRAQTAEALGDIGEAAEGVAPALVEALRDGNDRVRAKAAEALGKIGEGAAEHAVPSLVRALRDRDNWVSALAAEALGEMGGAAEEAVPALIKSVNHINPVVRANAIEALGKLGATAVDALPALEKAATDPDGGLRTQAMRAIGEIASADTGQLAAGLADTDPRVRAAAAEGLAKIGTPRDADVLLPLLEDSNDQVKYFVIRALARLSNATTALIDGLCRCLLEDDSPWVRETAAAALGQLGAGATTAGPALLRAARTGEAVVREQAFRSIAMIQPPEAVEAFTVGLRDAVAEIRKVASAGWMKMAAIPEEAIAPLVETLKDPDPQVRANAAHALSRLETLPPEAVPLLLTAATHANDGLRLNAVVALKVGAPAAAAELFKHLVDDPNSRIRLIAAGAVLAAGDDEVARQAVVAALGDPALRLRRVARDAIAELGERGRVFRDAVAERLAVEEDEEFAGQLRELMESLKEEPAVTVPS